MIFGYPVSEQQLNVLNYFGFEGELSLWLLRLLSLIILIFTLRNWKNMGKYSVAILATSPLMLVLVLVYPLVCLKFLIVTIFVQRAVKNKYYLVILGLILILFNIYVLGDNPAIFNKIDLSDAQMEVTKRISSEDSVRDAISLPLVFRRVSYNKFFISYKQILGEILPFFDIETIFFGEINPLLQKSVVMFYWPEIYLFVLGLYAIFRYSDKNINNLLIGLMIVSMIDYVFSEGAVYLRLILVMMPLSIVISAGFNYLVEMTRKSNIISTISLAGVSIFLLMGIGLAFYDLNVRTDYWLDNRPLAFEFWFKEIDKLNIDNYHNIYISSLVGDSKKYCYFYLGEKCKNNKFSFVSFDLSKASSPNTIYAGFAGEFVGSKFKNNIDSNWDKSSNIKIINKTNLRDTIANQYGNDIGVGIVQ